MSDSFLKEQARNNFNKAKGRAFFSRIFSLMRPEKSRLLSLTEVKNVVKPRDERYKGMQAVPIEAIVGSEGRYQDFNKTFLPKYEHIRTRWESIDMAHLKDIILPPIKLYKISNVYFVRDGNHRVSVAKSLGAYSIDAEVTELSSEIEILPGMSQQDLEDKIIQYERDKVFKETNLDKVADPNLLTFTATGRYYEVVHHIHVHKYYLNLDKTEEIPFLEAAKSWYENLFLPIIKVVHDENFLSRFPKRTEGDLYVWIIKHWDDLKKKMGENLPIEQAVHDYSMQFGQSMAEQFTGFLSGLFKKS